MKKFFRKTAIAALCVMLIFCPVQASAATRITEYRQICELADFIIKNYKFSITREELIDAALFSCLANPDTGLEGMVDMMLSVLDKNSSYFDKEEYKEFLSNSITGNIVGVGIYITSSAGRTIITGTAENSPAERAGFKENDIIAKVNDTQVNGMTLDEVKSLIVGEEGSSVRITIQREGSLYEYVLVRTSFKASDVAYATEGDIAYIDINHFQEGTAADTKKILDELDKEHISKIIIDLRNNTGGTLNEAIELSRLFVPEGVIARVEYKDASKNEIYYSYNKKPKYTLAVLVNGMTASSSEIFTGAVVDTGVAKSFGEKTFGKGTVQKIIPLAIGGAIRLTVAEYKTAGGRPVHEIGITPDQNVEIEYEEKDSSYFAEIDFSKDYSVGDDSPGVCAVEQRLEFLGYFEGTPDNTFDEQTKKALITFQTYAGLEVSGTAGLYTLLFLNDYDYSQKTYADTQYEAARDYLNSLK